MREKKKLERWIRETVRGADMQALRQQARDRSVSEETLMRYRAGLLSSEEESELESLLFLNEESLKFLAEVDQDIQATLAQGTVAPPNNWAGWVDRLAFLPNSRAQVLGWIGALAVGALASVLVTSVLLGPDSIPPYAPIIERPRSAAQPDVTVLPGGVELTQVDPMWPLFEPVGEIDSVERFRWAPLAGAPSYRLRLFDSSGAGVYERDRIARAQHELPVTVRPLLRPGSTYVWVVEPSDSRESKKIRGIGRFRIRPATE